MNLYIVYQIQDGENKLLSVCGSKDSLARIYLHFNELGYVDIKTRKITQNVPYLNIFDSLNLALSEEMKEKLAETDNNNL